MSERDPLIERLERANPVPPEQTDSASRSRQADELLARVTAMPHRGPTVRLLRRHQRSFLVATSAAAAILLALMIVLEVSEHAPASAAELLRRTSSVAAGRSGPVAHGTYLYSKSRSKELITSGPADEAYSAILSVEEESWVAADGSGRIVSSIGAPRFPGPRDRARWEAAGSLPFSSGESDETFPPGTLPYADVSQLPTDVSGLHSALEAQVASQDLPVDVAVFIRVAELLSRADAAPELRAALYQVASRLPGVDLVGPTTDPVGRRGVAVAMTYAAAGEADVQVVMIFDGETSRLLAQEQILLERAPWVDAEPGARLSFTAYLGSSQTDAPLAP